MKEKTVDKMFMYTAAAAFSIVLLAYTIASAYEIFNPVKEQVIVFNITGVVNNTNATTLVQVHLECIKFCGKDLAYSSNDKVYECWKQCALLGKT